MGRIAMSAVAVSAALAIGIGCSSGSSSTASTAPQCRGTAGTTGPGSAACNACLQSSCASQLTNADGACPDYFTCYEGCACTDTACLQGCLPAAGSSCANAFEPLASCISQSCGTPCDA